MEVAYLEITIGTELKNNIPSWYHECWSSTTWTLYYKVVPGIIHEDDAPSSSEWNYWQLVLRLSWKEVESRSEFKMNWKYWLENYLIYR